MGSYYYNWCVSNAVSKRLFARISEELTEINCRATLAAIISIHRAAKERLNDNHFTRTEYECICTENS
jgi:hypothetical protein